MIKINMAKDYTDKLGGRYIDEGPNSGEEFREKILIPAMEKIKNEQEDSILINMDGCYGYPSSFLNEAFGGLSEIYGVDSVLKALDFVCEDQPGLKNIIQEEHIKKKLSKRREEKNP